MKVGIVRNKKGRFVKGSGLGHPVYGGEKTRFKEGHKFVRGGEKGWFKKGHKMHLGKTPSMETRKKISMSLMGIKENEWRGFASDERRRIVHSKEYAEWRKAVFARDNWTCQSCNKRAGKGNKLYLEAHHLKRVKEYPDLVFEISNGVTLCKDCHSKTLKSKNKVGIIGSEGWVGSSMIKLFENSSIQTIPYDTGIGIGSKAEVNKCDVAFICVPTPNKKDGSLDASIVEECVGWCECPLIVIRSTVQPGTTDYLIKKFDKRIVVQPEYLGETPAHPMLDPTTRTFLILGGKKDDIRKLINLYSTVYNANVNIRQVSAYEAEVIKMTENRAIAFKVAQCQELYDVCESAGIDYYKIRDAVYGDDPRFNLWWTFVYPNKRGFNSKCIPKDVYGWVAWAESLGYEPKLTKDLLERNEKWISQS